MAIQKKLRELGATAICGNDITSSCLYVSAITISYAGQYAWIALLIVASVLFLFSITFIALSRPFPSSRQQ